MRTMRGLGKNGRRTVLAGHVIVLGTAETRLWESSEPKGCDFRDRMRKEAQRLATAYGASTEIRACAKAGGWVAEVVEPEGS